jgi:hypothetical protein
MLNLDAFAAAVEHRCSAWQAQGLSVEYRQGAETPKPAAWVVLESPQASGQLTVWVSGEADMDIGPVDGSNNVSTTTEGVTSQTVGDPLDELAARVLDTT